MISCLFSQNNYRVKELDLSHNQFGGRGGDHLGQMLGEVEIFQLFHRLAYFQIVPEWLKYGQPVVTDFKSSQQRRSGDTRPELESSANEGSRGILCRTQGVYATPRA